MRRIKKMNQSQLSAAIGYSTSVVSFIENDVLPASEEIAVLMRGVLGLTPEVDAILDMLETVLEE
jgi:hypothetical protein